MTQGALPPVKGAIRYKVTFQQLEGEAQVILR